MVVSVARSSVQCAAADLPSAAASRLIESTIAVALAGGERMRG